MIRSYCPRCGDTNICNHCAVCQNCGLDVDSSEADEIKNKKEKNDTN